MRHRRYLLLPEKMPKPNDSSSAPEDLERTAVEQLVEELKVKPKTEFMSHENIYATKRERKVPKRKNKSLRKGKSRISNGQKSRIIKTFFEILHAIKLYHWKTKSYAQHQSTDDLHEKLSSQTDRFIEVLMGKTALRINMVEDKMKLYDFD